MSIAAKHNETYIADADLDSYQYTIQVGSAGPRCNRAASAGAMVIGVLQNKPKSGEHATVTMLGKTRCMAGGTVAAGAEIATTASATGLAATSGQYILGISTTGVASGGYFEMIVTQAGYKG